jgi:hypothetical protein
MKKTLRSARGAPAQPAHASRPPAGVVRPALHVAGGLLAAGALVPATGEGLTGAQEVTLAFAHDFAPPGDSPQPHLLPATRARFDATGALREFDQGGAVRWPDPQPVGHTGNDGTVAWGRWGHGRIEGEGGHGHYDITGGEGVRNALYYVAGVPAATLPGPDPAVYAILGGGVGPSAGEGAMAAITLLDEGRLTIGPDGAELALRITVPSGEYTVKATGLEVTGTTFRTTPDSKTSVEGVFCFGGCTLRLEGFLAGPQAQRAALAYHVDVTVLSEDVAGVVAWTRSD